MVFHPEIECVYYTHVYNQYTLSSNPRVICTANPNRIGLIICNNTPVFASLTQDLRNSPSGFPWFLVAPGDNLFLDWDQVGAIVTFQWWLSSTNSTDSSRTITGVQVNTTEIIYTPK